MDVPLPTVTPVLHPSSGPSSACTLLGAVITNLDLQHLFDPALRTPEQARETAAFKAVEEALYEYKVLVFKRQQELEPDRQFEFVKAFDPDAPAEHNHNDATVSHKGHKSLLYGIGNSIGSHPEVKLVGGGVQDARFGGRTLRQADHTSYHYEPLTDEEREKGFTRWHRWHMDASLFRTSLPLVTSLLCLSRPLPPSPSPSTSNVLTVRWDDGSGHEMEVEAGSTGFLQGSAVLEGLSEEDREWVEGAEVEYAPWPYQWSSPSRGNSNGLGSHPSSAPPIAVEDLPSYQEGDVKRYPMVWTCPKTGRKGLMVHPVAVIAIHRSAPLPAITSLPLVRSTLSQLQLPALTPANIWAPGYEVGDLVLFNNRAVYHSATDYPEGWQATRTMLQAHIPASFEPR